MDPTPAVRDWVVALDTELTTCGTGPCVSPVSYDGRRALNTQSPRDGGESHATPRMPPLAAFARTSVARNHDL